MKTLFEQDVIICKRCTGDLMSHLSEKMKRILRRYGLVWKNTSTHEGRLTQELFECLSRELNDVIRSHSGPGKVTQLIARVGNSPNWVDILDSSDAELAA